MAKATKGWNENESVMKVKVKVKVNVKVKSGRVFGNVVKGD